MQDGGCHPVDGCYFPDQPYAGADFPWLAANVKKEAAHRPAAVLDQAVRRRQGRLHRHDPGGHADARSRSRGSRAGTSRTRSIPPTRSCPGCAEGAGVEAIVVLLHEGGSTTGTTDSTTASASRARSWRSRRTCTPRSTPWSPGTPTSPTTASSRTRPARPAGDQRLLLRARRLRDQPGHRQGKQGRTPRLVAAVEPRRRSDGRAGSGAHRGPRQVGAAGVHGGNRPVGASLPMSAGPSPRAAPRTVAPSRLSAT